MSEINDWNAMVIREFRANGGVMGGQFSGTPLLLLHTTGARSGKAYVSPLAYTRDGDRIVIIASKGGAPENPAWYHNLRANPQVKVELGSEVFEARATVAAEPERTRLFNQMGAQLPGFLEYQQKTERIIPVVVLERLS